MRRKYRRRSVFPLALAALLLLSGAAGGLYYHQMGPRKQALFERAAYYRELAAGEALPSMRLLARELRISLITTKRAYEELEREGLVVTVPGRGSFVAAANWELLREEHRRRMEEHLTAAAAAARMGGVSRAELLEVAGLLYDESGPAEDPTEQEETS